MPGIVDPVEPWVPSVPSPDPDDDIFSAFFDLGGCEAAVPLMWEKAVRCDQCLTPDTKQPRWGQECPQCDGKGVRYLPGTQITGFFRGRSQYQSYRVQGELQHGEAQLTVPLAVNISYVDRLVRDRITVLAAVGDQERGTVFFPATKPVPFVFNGIQRAWRVQLASIDRQQDLAP